MSYRKWQLKIPELKRNEAMPQISWSSSWWGRDVSCTRVFRVASMLDASRNNRLYSKQWLFLPIHRQKRMKHFLPPDSFLFLWKSDSHEGRPKSIRPWTMKNRGICGWNFSGQASYLQVSKCSLSSPFNRKSLWRLFLKSFHCLQRNVECIMNEIGRRKRNFTVENDVHF